MSDLAKKCADRVRQNGLEKYKIGMILGSGLGSLADEVQDATRIPYTELNGFPVSTVTSHASELVAGTLSGVPVVLLAGRAHYYESGNASIMRTPVETLKELGCDILLATNAAGSLNQTTPPGQPMLINDHINWSGMNPLIGEEAESRFLDMSAAYDPALRALMHKSAQKNDVSLSEGVYMWFSGPSFETPAEIRMAKTLGGDAVGMSTVPEVILARFFGMRVIAMSMITNYGAGLQAHGLSHDETKSVALSGMATMKKLVQGFAREVGNE